MKERVLTLAEAAKEVPLSKTTLYRVAERGDADSPFRKVEGRWLTTESDLIGWIRGDRRKEDPAKEKTVADLMEEVQRRRTE
jgi:hypothetical protein